MYKPSREMPKEGRWTAIWTYKGNVWCGNYEWRDGQLYTFEEETDGFTEKSGFPYSGQENIIYVQLEQ